MVLHISLESIPLLSQYIPLIVRLNDAWDPLFKSFLGGSLPCQPQRKLLNNGFHASFSLTINGMYNKGMDSNGICSTNFKADGITHYKADYKS